MSDNPPLSARKQRKATLGWPFLLPGGEKQGPCGPCVGDSKGWAYFAQPSPNRHFAVAEGDSPARRGRAMGAHRLAYERPPVGWPFFPGGEKQGHAGLARPEAARCPRTT